MNTDLTTAKVVAWLREQHKRCKLPTCVNCKYGASADLIESLTAERDALAGLVLAKDEALNLLMRYAKVAVSVGCDGCYEGEQPYYLVNLDKQIEQVDALALTQSAAVAQVAKWRAASERLKQVQLILLEAEELNMSNYTEAQVSALNDSMIEA